jgi:periplasmic mercuric ion binding protein
MKQVKIMLVMAFALVISTVTNAQDAKRNLRNFEPKPKSATFKVYGKCGMCKHRIENALKINGIRSANWDVDSKILAVQYDLNETITGEYKIQQLVASAGHDTEKYKATNALYQKLPECCHYERKQ